MSAAAPAGCAPRRAPCPAAQRPAGRVRPTVIGSAVRGPLFLSSPQATVTQDLVGHSWRGSSAQSPILHFPSSMTVDSPARRKRSDTAPHVRRYRVRCRFVLPVSANPLPPPHLPARRYRPRTPPGRRHPRRTPPSRSGRPWQRSPRPGCWCPCPAAHLRVPG